MRNLSLRSTQHYSLPNASHVSAIALDLDQKGLYAVSEHNLAEEAEVEVTIWSLPVVEMPEDHSPELISVSFFKSALVKDTQHQVVSVRFLPDNRRLAICMRSGDIVMYTVDDEGVPPETEGTFDSGILSATWSPDDSQLALLTGELTLILMTSSLDIISEKPLHTSEFGEDAPINVGWGSKQTQFHGSLGKQAAQATAPAVIGSSPDDDGLPRISWRGDGAYFVVSSLLARETKTRVLRVYNREGILQATSEAIPGLEHPVSWRPSGNLIASTQRFGFPGGGSGKRERHDIVFFERNGLRHGEFGVRLEPLGLLANTLKGVDQMEWGYRVKEISWNADSTVLLLWLETPQEDFIQLWTTGNYHWYLKHQIHSKSLSNCRIQSVVWHPESPLELFLTTEDKIIQRTYSWETVAAIGSLPRDTGCVAVQDGLSVGLTPFRTQNVPPPMSSLKLDLRDASLPIHLSFSTAKDVLGILWESGRFELWDLNTRVEPGRGLVMAPSLSYSGTAEWDLHYRQIAIGSNGSVVSLLASGGVGNDIVVTFRLEVQDENKQSLATKIQMPHRNGRVGYLGDTLVWQSPLGELYYVTQDGVSPKLSSFGAFCFSFIPLDEPSHLCIGLSDSSQLFATSMSAGPAQVIASNVTSYTSACGFIIFTTTSHEACFAPLQDIVSYLHDQKDIKQLSSSWEKRRVERGSRIVVAVPSNMSLVLQMPRGNLETINPRPLVLAVVKEDLALQKYRKAFLACRKHRIDLGVLVTHDPSKFLQDIELFLEQVHEVDHLNLFLTSISRGSQDVDTISKVCDTIREVLESKDLIKYVNSVLTAHVVKKPPDYEAGLSILLKLREAGGNEELVDDAVKYIIFLADADRLFDVALGMYDFELVLMIAQHSQKDPAEFLPFLRELSALEKYYQHFKIDDHLKRYESALKNLSQGGEDKFEEALAYIELHRLYAQAIGIWRNTDRINPILVAYGEHLYDRKEYKEAALAFIEARAPQKALIAFEKALEWQDLFDLALRIDVDEDDILSMGYRVAEELTAKRRYLEASYVLLDYAKDVREAVVSLAQGNLFSEARRIISLHRVPDLMQEIIHPAVLESGNQICEDIMEMRDQIRKQRTRLGELRIKKVEEPDAFYNMEDTALHNVDVMTDISTPVTQFTRYTAAPSTTVSRKSKQSSKTRRKMERKIGSGKKGTVDEEEYLLGSVTKLVGRFASCKDEASRLLPHLYQLTPEHRDQGATLQNVIDEFQKELEEAVEWIWTKPPHTQSGSTGGEMPIAGSDASGYYTGLQNNHRGFSATPSNTIVNPIDKMPKPSVSGGDEGWRIKLLDL